MRDCPFNPAAKAVAGISKALIRAGWFEQDRLDNFYVIISLWLVKFIRRSFLEGELLLPRIVKNYTA